MSYTESHTRSIRPSVVLAAPTGIAAIQINGATIHNLFGLEVQQGRDTGLKCLDNDKLNTKRNLFVNVKLIIIDEISMCSNSITLCYLRFGIEKNHDFHFFLNFPLINHRLLLETMVSIFELTAISKNILTLKRN